MHKCVLDTKSDTVWSELSFSSEKCIGNISIHLSVVSQADGLTNSSLATSPIIGASGLSHWTLFVRVKRTTVAPIDLQTIARELWAIETLLMTFLGR